MIDEAEKAGLNFNHATVNQLAWGIPRKGSPFTYVAPDVAGELHHSMTAAWRVLEYIPKSAKYKEWPDREVYFGFYIPDCEPRLIPEGAHVHESVVKRMDAVKDYRPVNLPASFVTVPMPVRQVAAVVAPEQALPSPLVGEGASRSEADEGLHPQTP
jgi:hypothetical protein